MGRKWCGVSLQTYLVAYIKNKDKVRTGELFLAQLHLAGRDNTSFLSTFFLLVLFMIIGSYSSPADSTVFVDCQMPKTL